MCDIFCAVIAKLLFGAEAPQNAARGKACVYGRLHINAAVADIQAFGGGDA